ncbi:MAG: superoxide dismutase family protein [Alphaproteobacteria bacterium]|nr:superoxide dismutase family protein [Alphaproteobacteria bacterium]
MRNLVIGSLLLGLGACATPAERPPGATAGITDPSGRVVARASLRQAPGGIAVHVEAGGLPAGTYGVHLHAVGRCEPPAFASAGGHWNPTGRQHGRDNPAGAHLGDLPNLVVGGDGRGVSDFTVAGGMLAGGGANVLLDADGAALVIHAQADDYRTDPSGNSGARIACGTIAPA